MSANKYKMNYEVSNKLSRLCIGLIKQTCSAASFLQYYTFQTQLQNK